MSLLFVSLETSHKDDDTQWLTYWVVFASFSVIESVSDIFISWMPFYWLGKCAFLVWCMSPMELNGSVVVYRQVLLNMNEFHYVIVFKRAYCIIS